MIDSTVVQSKERLYLHLLHCLSFLDPLFAFIFFAFFYRTLRQGPRNYQKLHLKILSSVWLKFLTVSFNKYFDISVIHKSISIISLIHKYFILKEEPQSSKFSMKVCKIEIRTCTNLIAMKLVLVQIISLLRKLP